MLILHADTKPLKESGFEALIERADTAYVQLESMESVLKFLSKHSVSLLLIGEQLKDSTGLELIANINHFLNIIIPIIYIVDDPDDYHIENYSTIGIKDCIVRSDINIKKVERYLIALSEQKKLYKGIKDLSVAVIDDSHLTLKVVSKLLHDEGIEDVKTFDDPVTLLKEYESFSLFIVDIVMPEISGDKLVGMIRRMSPNSIIIAMSAVDNVKTISQVLNSGADDYIVKPFNNVELKARIRTNYRSFMLLKELEDKNRALDRLSKTDSLTGAFNHGFIFNTIKKEIIKAKGSGYPLSILLIDLDFFKKVNDTYGHGVGDEVLRALSRLFMEQCRQGDLFGRYGGEEFLYVMTNTVLEDASVIVNRLNKLFSSLEIEGIHHPITFSGGLVQWNKEEDDKAFIKRADDLLYRAKESGRDIIIQ